MKMAVSPLPIKLFSGGLLLALVAAGCVTKSQAHAQAQAAYLAGQTGCAGQHGGGPAPQCYYFRSGGKSEVPYVVGLTLAQAIATANYTSRYNPKLITITRQGEDINVNSARFARRPCRAVATGR